MKLNKQSFWNEVLNANPKAAELFLRFIDKYKVDNDWYQLFNAHTTFIKSHYPGGDNKIEIFTPKYHELPVAMQLGIFMEFLHQYSVEYEGTDTVFIEEVKRIIIDNLGEMNDEL